MQTEQTKLINIEKHYIRNLIKKHFYGCTFDKLVLNQFIELANKDNNIKNKQLIQYIVDLYIRQDKNSNNLFFDMKQLKKHIDEHIKINCQNHT